MNHHCSHRWSNAYCQAKSEDFPELNEEKTCSHYKKGEYIFKEGAKPYGVFCINYGKAKLIKMGSDGKDQIIRLAKEGDIIGYRSLLSSDRYNASAIALEDCAMCFLPKEMFLQIMMKDSNLVMEMFKLLSEDLKNSDNQMTHIAQNPVRERVAEAILFVKETYGYEADGRTISAVISREDLANIVGTATESAIRMLSDLNKEGVIKLVGKKIRINDLAKLKRIANIND
ncbi:MAG TPA: Crp/Fnr family transcriptional regulator [Saprospiraceae bacterium]|nr:Crp/Fnr family transcriptional regulator [Saprospiraceae bacterium]HQW54826.1 Crp/Fnr family transcriptional regulator [Saprospiraceae bacterium]